MSDRITEREYIEGCQSIAVEGARMAQAGEFGHDDDAREGLDQWLWESIDGHSWVIYTYQAQQILSLSQNDGYSAENFGVESVVSDGSINWSALAFGALYADVMEELHRIDGFDPNDPSPEPDEPELPECERCGEEMAIPEDAEPFCQDCKG